MKKLKFLLIIGLVTVLSGCKFEYNMNIDKDKKVDFDVILAVPSISFGDNEESLTTEGPKEEETLEGTEEVTTTGEEENNEEITTIGEETEESDDSLLNTTKIDCDELQAQLTTWKVEVYDDGTNKGCKLHKTYSSIDDISNDKEVSVELLGILKGKFDDTQLFTKNNDKYTAHFTFNMDTLVKESGEEMDDMTKAMMSMTEFKYSIELPYKNLSNNASTVENDGKKLTWNLDGTKDNEIKFSFDFKGKKEIPWLYIGIGAGALLVIIVLCIVLGKGKKCDCSNCTCDKKEENNTKAEPTVEVKEETVIENEKPEVVDEPVIEEVTEEVVENTETETEVTNENVEESVEPNEETKDNQ